MVIGSVFAKNARLDEFVFNNSEMQSSDGNKNYWESGFIPNFSVNSKTGKLRAKNAEIEGNITSNSLESNTSG